MYYSHILSVMKNTIIISNNIIVIKKLFFFFLHYIKLLENLTFEE